MVLYDSLPRPRRSISAAAALEDRCDNSRRTGSSSASRAAAAAAFFAASLLPEEPSFCRGPWRPQGLHGALADHAALLLGERGVDVQGERIDVAPQRADDERHPLHHQPESESRKSRPCGGMSASHPSKADIGRTFAEVRFVPQGQEHPS